MAGVGQVVEEAAQGSQVGPSFVASNVHAAPEDLTVAVQ